MCIRDSREGVAAFRGEDADKPVTTALNAGSSSSSLELLTKAGGVTGSAVQDVYKRQG